MAVVGDALVPLGDGGVHDEMNMRIENSMVALVTCPAS
jgi:hypothetical protein